MTDDVTLPAAGSLPACPDKWTERFYTQWLQKGN